MMICVAFERVSPDHQAVSPAPARSNPASGSILSKAPLPTAVNVPVRIVAAAAIANMAPWLCSMASARGQLRTLATRSAPQQRHRVRIGGEVADDPGSHALWDRILGLCDPLVEGTARLFPGTRIILADAGKRGKVQALQRDCIIPQGWRELVRVRDSAPAGSRARPDPRPRRGPSH